MCMTSASELFYNRRSRFGRTSHDLGLDSLPPDRSFHHSPTRARRSHHFSGSGGGGGNHRHDLDGCDPLRRYPHARNGFNRASHQDRSAFRVEESTSQNGSSNRVDTENLISRSRPALNANDRLPGSVLLARARLCERLRGLPLSGSRMGGRVTSNANSGELWLVDDSRPFDASDWETANFTGLSISGSRSTDLDSQTVRQQLLQQQNNKPSGLTQEALECLQLELFANEGTGSEQKESAASRPQDCSICLESYVPGDQLICLPCEHRFHASCLHPWVRICGDCPCCRRAITVKKITTKAL